MARRKPPPLTEADWPTCSDLYRMLELLIGKSSDRKFRLFACACCRRVWRLLPNDASRNAVVIAEEYADGLRPREDLPAARDAVNATIPDLTEDERAKPTRTTPGDWARMAANSTVWPSDYSQDDMYTGTVAQ